MMREHIEATARVQYIITEGEMAANIVPDRAAVKLTFRNTGSGRVNQGVAWIKDMAKGAALATQTKAIALDYFGVHEMLPNKPFDERMQQHLEAVGLPDFTEEEQAFATDLQKVSGLEATGITQEIEPLPDETSNSGPAS